MYGNRKQLEHHISRDNSKYWDGIERPYSRPAVYPSTVSDTSEAGLGGNYPSIHLKQQPTSSLPASYMHTSRLLNPPLGTLAFADSEAANSTHHYGGRIGTEPALDAYDQALLAEIDNRSDRRDDIESNLAPGRLSLPGHTTPCKVMQAPVKKRFRRNPTSSSQDFKEQLAQYVRTPPNQTSENFSSENGLSSSPLLRFSRRPHLPAGPSPSIGRPRPDQDSGQILPNASTSAGLQPSKDDFDDCIEGQHDPATNRSATASSAALPALSSLPVIQGIRLICLNEMPDRFRSVFPYNPLNAIQSRCYPTAYLTDHNLVVSAPTGGGKTAIFELAICRLVSNCNHEQFKIIYMAPTKALCSERQRDWQAKFATLDLRCAQLTGDTDNAHLRSVQSAHIVITTPEKWDSMTRQWKDHRKLMELVKLFLIDEVHILHDVRGATLEAVVSRMKSIGSGVRFVALSATVPNTEDVAKWLGKDQTDQQTSAIQEKFGEEFRPVKLQRHVVGIKYEGNDYGFDGQCDPKLLEIIAQHGNRKPVMIFCMTRKSATTTAHHLANVWASQQFRNRYWPAPSRKVIVGDPDLSQTLLSAVAFHHAGLESNDRQSVEKGFLTGQISIICCTSTLAVGINLPCHLVIIKNTVSYQGDSLKEYVDLEILQMLGRAGRPQYDDSAVAVILTKQTKVLKYEKLVSGSEPLESSLHLNLIDHLNAEIGLGTIHDLRTAKRWLTGTFFYVRLRSNPGHYKLPEDTSTGDLSGKIETICQRDIALLNSADLVTDDTGTLKATELGNIMTRYYVNFTTMQVFLGLGFRPKMSDILSALVQASEYNEIRLKVSEKRCLKEMNSSNGIKFPIKVDLAQNAHKRSLLIQAELGGVDFPMDDQYTKYKRQFQLEKIVLFSNVHRLIRCIIDIQIHLQDAVGTRNALELARSLSAKVWDNSPLQLKQVPQIGPIAIRKLVTSGITSIEALEAVEAHRIELLLSKNPPFGNKLLSSLRDFPKLRVHIKLLDKRCRNPQPVSVKLALECGFMNDKVPASFNRTPIHVCLLTERSDGQLLDFRRISASRLDNGQSIIVHAELASHTQYITCYVMCDAIAGTLRYAELKPDLPAHMFPSIQIPQSSSRALDLVKPDDDQPDDEYGMNDLDDQDLVETVNDNDFHDIDQLGLSADQNRANIGDDEQAVWRPERLANGKWACNHRCKDKKACRHMCCRDGVEKLPKPPKTGLMPPSNAPSDVMNKVADTSRSSEVQGSGKVQTTIIEGKKRTVEEIDLAGSPQATAPQKRIARGDTALESLHEKVTKGVTFPKVASGKPSLNTSDLAFGISPNNHQAKNSERRHSTDYSDLSFADLPSPAALLNHPVCSTEIVEEQRDASKCIKRFDETMANHSISSSQRDMTKEIDDPLSSEDHQSSTSAAVDVIQNYQAQNTYDQGEAGYGDDDWYLSPRVACPEPDQAPPQASQHTEGHNGDMISARLYDREARLPQIPDTAITSEIGQEGQDAPSEDSEQKRQIRESAPGHMTVSSQRASSPQPPCIRAGLPAWVHDFDAAFIAEYQDIVDFV